MKTQLAFLTALALSLFSLSGCLGVYSDVPVSWSSEVPDNRLLGYWQDADAMLYVIPDSVAKNADYKDSPMPPGRYDSGTTYAIRKQADGTALLEIYSFDPKTGTYRKISDPEGDDPPELYRLYFATLKGRTETVHLASFLAGWEIKDETAPALLRYGTFRYRILESGEVAVQVLNRDYLKQTAPKPVDTESGLEIEFGTPATYRKYLKEHLDNPALYDSVWVMRPVRRFEDLVRPVVE
jgi:hypothetical protein